MLIISAANLPSLCASSSSPGTRHHQIVRKLFSIVSLPQNGWPFERLQKTIWSPLKALRDATRPREGFPTYRYIKAVDCTGVFEETCELSDWDSEPGTKGDSHLKDEGNHDDQNEASKDSSDEVTASENSLAEGDAMWGLVNVLVRKKIVRQSTGPDDEVPFRSMRATSTDLLD